MTMALDREAARALDAADPLRGKRAGFALPDGVIYLNGNSLGAAPLSAAARVGRLVRDEWARDLIGSWNVHDWIGAPQRLGARIARLIGAEADEVAIADSTSVNLYKLLVAACTARPGRKTILSEPGNFPTDLYIAQGVAATLGDRTVRTVEIDRLCDAIDADTAVVLLTHVHYKSGHMLDMAAITAAAHAQGALVLWDLSHSVGALPVDLNGCAADLAVGCGYKYLNGGPGAPAFLYVARRLQAELVSPLTGWMGHDAPFAFGDDYVPATGIARFLCGTPPILAMAALEEGLAQFDDVSFDDILTKSRTLGDHFIAMVEARCAGHDLELISPRDAARRGSHVSFAHPDAYALCQALIARGVVGDFRAPDAIRFGFTPLYTSFEDIWNAVEILERVLDERAWDRSEYRVRAAVT
ncbi:kynureninase [Rhizorhabdus wittichii RW1]|uniref:Kynureninase n=1 Tax=Rhizorhabdus wittichii (strain DSM 6014 / CCUG 31198 / JCM 15750 / NBRC 105917 / EY 4224 / RW1) TaxID=392499 RepID=A0A9J9H8Q1_RHIWR|nr:kynureninase [Rhizorhabdus wittichii RW1]